MKLKTITYSRKKNLGNYETEDISLGAELQEGEDEKQAIEQLKLTVREALNIPEPKPKPEQKNYDEKPF